MEKEKCMREKKERCVGWGRMERGVYLVNVGEADFGLLDFA